MSLLEGIIRLYIALCFLIGYFHYLLIRNIYQVQELEFAYLYSLGMGLGMIIGGLANIFFRIPELIRKSKYFCCFLNICFKYY